MKTLTFQRTRHWALFSLLLLLALHAGAQRYNIYVTGAPETKCIIPNEYPFYLDEFPKTMVACQGSEVDYTAYYTSEVGDYASVIDWKVVGAINYNVVSNNMVHVEWGNAESGELIVTVTTNSGRVLTHHQVVQLIAPPVVSAITVPAGTYDNHTIFVCSGGSVEFTDNSDAGSNDIAGYYWDGPAGKATTRSYTLDNILGNCTVTHRVYNSCGCYDEEEFEIIVQYGEPLQLDCYGTACDSSTVTYHALSPICTDYLWAIEGGHIVAGQNTPTVTVIWDSVRNGYGVVGIDGTVCGGTACPNKMSVKIPIIQKGLPVSGPTAVCEGEGAIYSVPLYGSTLCLWDIYPNISHANTNEANQVEYIFTTPGTYRLHAKLHCEFLDCGPFYSDTITIEVKPRLSIVGEDEMCITNIGTLTTDPSDNVIWNVYEEGNAQPIYTSLSPEPSPTPIFSQAGRYKITAQSSNYCNQPEFFLTVKDAPPAPTLSEMDPNNPAIACPNSSIVLRSNLSNPYLTTVWIPTCSGVTPDTVSGDDVTISYGSTVCNVDVYTYDRKLRCLSQNSYTHIVKPLVLDPVNIATPITVCPGSRIKWTDADVHPQDGVIYEWQFKQDIQFCATIESDRFDNKVTIKVNDFDPVPTTPITFEVQLIRTYCSGIKDTTKIPVIITNLRNTPLQIAPIGPICQNSIISFSGSGCDDFKWYFPGSSSPVSGSSVNHQFTEAGPATIIVSCNPYDFCGDTSYLPHITIDSMVHPAPPLFRIINDGANVYTDPQLSTTDYTFQWNHTTVNNWSVSADPNVTLYSCTVTDNNYPYCSRTEDNYVASACVHLNVNRTGINYCTKEVTFEVSNPPGPISWHLENFPHGTPSYSGTYNEIITVPVNTVGRHAISAACTINNICYSGGTSFTMDFIPDFILEKQCSTVVVHNHSKYLDGTKTMTLTMNGTPRNGIHVSKDTIVFNTGTGGPFNFMLTNYDGNAINPACFLGSVTIVNSSGQLVSITSANTVNPGQTCDNTPIELTASIAAPHTIAHTHWDFGDHNSCLDTTGNAVSHTFKHQPSSYIVSLTVIDENGCTSNGSLTILSNNNVLKDELLQIDPNTPITCPGATRNIEYKANYSLLPFGAATYYWSTQTAPSSQGYNTVHHTDDYSVLVRNDNYCETRASVNVGFLNKPRALIIPKKYHYCVGETIVLYGEPSESDNYDYHWTITEPNMGTILNTTTTSPMLTLPTPPSTCDLTVELIVEDRTTSCVSDLVTETISVKEAPQAPTIAISNTYYCIGNPPVELESHGPTTDIHWSNGDFGPTAQYYYPGHATAHYYDPISGCRSELADIIIPAAPDFDALLTGCYEFCSKQLPNMLPAYGLLPTNQTFDWKWFYNNGNDFDDDYAVTCPIFLPLHGLNEYHLDVDYFRDCNASSKPLVLREDSVCTCKNIIANYSYTCYNSGCNIYYDITVTICNNSSESVCFNSLTPLFDNLIGNGIYMSNTTFNAPTILPNGWYVFQIQLIVNEFDNTRAIFRLRDRNCSDCEFVFGIDLMVSLPYINFGCTQTVTTAYTNQNGDLSDVSTFYYDFRLDLSSVTSPSVVAVWSEPSAIIDYTLNGTNLEGIGVYYGDPDQQDLICIHALLCYNGQLCLWTYCIYVNNIPRRVIPYINRSAGNEKSGRGKEITEDASEPKLMPNPATGDVSIVGTSNEVEEVLVMDMNGRKMATFDKTDHFNVAALPSGIYIVRVRTSFVTDGDTSEVPQKQVTYLKLVKK